MPIFEYTCRGCGHQFETLVRDVDPPPSCPTCQGHDLERAISLFAAKSDDRSQTAFNVAKKRAAKIQQGKSREELAQAQREHDDHGH